MWLHGELVDLGTILGAGLVLAVHVSPARIAPVTAASAGGALATAAGVLCAGRLLRSAAACGVRAECPKQRMASNYVLIDCKNVNPGDLEVLEQNPFRVFVSVGSNQARIPFDLAVAMQSPGDEGQYLRSAGSGKNALDVHIRCYIGDWVAQDKSAYFHIISPDTGFATLIKHLKARGIRILRERNLAGTPAVRMPAATAGVRAHAVQEYVLVDSGGEVGCRPRALPAAQSCVMERV